MYFLLGPWCHFTPMCLHLCVYTYCTSTVHLLHLQGTSFVPFAPSPGFAAASWLEERRRYKWRHATRHAVTYAQVAASTAILRECLPWAYLEEAIEPLTRKDFLTRHGAEMKSLLVGIPDEHTKVRGYGCMEVWKYGCMDLNIVLS